MNGRHVNFAVVVSRNNCDDVTRFQVKNTTYIRGTVVTFSWPRGLSHGHVFAVHSNKYPSKIVIVDLQVDIVPSIGRHSQFSIMVLHPSREMAVRGSNRPVFDHYSVKRKLMLILCDFHWLLSCCNSGVMFMAHHIWQSTLKETNGRMSFGRQSLNYSLNSYDLSS